MWCFLICIKDVALQILEQALTRNGPRIIFLLNWGFVATTAHFLLRLYYEPILRVMDWCIKHQPLRCWVWIKSEKEILLRSRVFGKVATKLPLTSSKWIKKVPSHPILSGISYVRLAGRSNFARQLEAFKYNDSIQVMLLPFRTGSNGLNLTEATHG